MKEEREAFPNLKEKTTGQLFNRTMSKNDAEYKEVLELSFCGESICLDID
jgi:hypothetical protein